MIFAILFEILISSSKIYYKLNNKFPLSVVRLSKLTLVARHFTIKLISWLFFFKFNRIYISGSVSSIWFTELTIAKVCEFKFDQNSDVPAS